MSTGLLERPVVEAAPSRSGMPARRALLRWAWRLFRREWRQQLLVLGLIVLAVGATVVAAAVATNTPPPANAGFGKAQDAATVSGSGPRVADQISRLEHRFGAVDVIANETRSVPGTVRTFQLRAQDPHGPYGGPMLSLVSGRYPADANEVAVTAGVASDFGLRIGGVWQEGGTARRVVGIVQNPQSLLDEFALVVPGQVASPTQVVVLFDAHGVTPASIGPNVSTPASVAAGNALNPETISLAGLTVGMLLIALVAVGGFTVLAQRRLRSIGMLASIGATDRHIRTVVMANGVIVGVVGAILGTALGVAAWLAYRPHLEQSAHHVIGALSLPWLVVILAVVLAVVATFFAASRPARSIAKVPIVAALSGRPAPPRRIRRSAVPGIVFLVIAFLLLGYSGSTNHGSGNGGMPELVLGLVALIPAVILLAPFCLSVLARIGRRSPVAVRLALRDLARYRARSGSALAAISIGVMIAVIIAIVAAARYGDILDYAGPNVASNQLLVYAPGSPGGPGGPNTVSPGALASAAKTVRQIGRSLGAPDPLELDITNANLDYTGRGRQWNGAIFVATPQLLRMFGIHASQVSPQATILSMRPGLSGVSGLQLTWCNAFGAPVSTGGGPAGGNDSGGNKISYVPCTSSGQMNHPVLQEIGALPSGTSAPNTVITEHAVRSLHLQVTAAGWLIQTAQPLTAAQVHDADATASSAGLTVESKNDQPTSSEVINWATAFGIALALCILAMSVGLIRSETASDLRTLTATGASSRTRRSLAAATAGGLGLLGAVLGTFAGYIGVIGWLRGNSLNGGISALGHVPVTNLVVVLGGLPLIAVAAGWVLAGREPGGMAHQPIE
ncbi:MAG TPA: FtsX-like permease family protein [Acidimicrobiales bacterium]|nr:FtsX-like permease family protein [Acidimicrobiales bacterium]